MYAFSLHSGEALRKPRVFVAQCEAPRTVRANFVGEERDFLQRHCFPLSDSDEYVNGSLLLGGKRSLDRIISIGWNYPGQRRYLARQVQGECSGN